MTQIADWTLSRVAVFDKNRVYVLAYSKREPGTRVFRWTGEWNNYHVQAISAGICAIRGAAPEILTLGANGSVHRAAPDGQAYEDIVEEKPSKHGLLRDIRAIGGRVYATGVGRQVHSRKDRTWQRCDQGVVEDPTAANLSGFESIDGFGEDEIYAAGNQGEIWCRRQGAWQRSESPTKIVLENVLCAPDGVVYLSGQSGVVIRGRAGRWELVEHGLTEDTFWDMAWFNDRLWLSTTEALYMLQGSELARVETGLPRDQTFRYLDANEQCLWSSGERHLAAFDGAAWTRIPSP
ncbi:hypothetical protein OCJ37_00635 [Xanthomonas sp. AM6]|uniref:hypothetical protein n=1 Tax=Xanthomonas sp. AM6 TaxID=2982531 RepID=UPI0021D82CC4|nr:hypothetical protein [Xanthomonas sp. AM6]UYB52512.1 hypothetical protein OCJ37_00635 [Xanthomonas sp. AM6]